MSSDKIRMLLIGAGFMGNTHIGAAREIDHVSYCGVVDTDITRARDFASEFGLSAYDNLAKALDTLKPDAVDICTPTPSHLPIIELCTGRNIHCLCEKPVSLTVEDALKIKALDSDSGRIMVAQVLRFWPEYIYALETAAKSTYGGIRAIDCKRMCSIPDWNGWMTLPDKGGGAVIDLQIHDMDFILQLLGPPQSMKAKGHLYNGAVNTVYNSLNYSTVIPVWNEASMVIPESYPFRMWYKIVFESCIIEFDFWRPKGERLLICPSGGESFVPGLPDIDAYGEEIAYFGRQLLDGEDFDQCPLSDSVTALEMCLASDRSVKSGKTELL